MRNATQPLACPLLPLPPTVPACTAAQPVVLDVRGMKCGGCSAAVKRILLQQPGVAGAAVNLLTETAVVRVAVDGSSGGGASGGQQAAALEMAAAAAEALTAKGFPASLRSADDEGVAGSAAALAERKADEMRKRCVAMDGRGCSAMVGS